MSAIQIVSEIQINLVPCGIPFYSLSGAIGSERFFRFNGRCSLERAYLMYLRGERGMILRWTIERDFGGSSRISKLQNQ